MWCATALSRATKSPPTSRQVRVPQVGQRGRKVADPVGLPARGCTDPRAQASTGSKPGRVTAHAAPTARVNECCFQWRPVPLQVGHTFFPRHVSHTLVMIPPVLPDPSHRGQRPRPRQVLHVAIIDSSRLCRVLRAGALVILSKRPCCVGQRLAIMRGAGQPTPTRGCKLSRPAGWSGGQARTYAIRTAPRGAQPRQTTRRRCQLRCRAARTRLVFAIHQVFEIEKQVRSVVDDIEQKSRIAG